MSDQIETQPNAESQTPPDDARARLRRGVYWLLIAIAAGNMTGRILAVNSVDKDRLEAYRIADRLKQDTQRYREEGLTGAALDAQIAERKLELQEKLALQRPFLSSNDRSRWATVRSLVEHGTYEIDAIVAQPNWDTIDMVKHKNAAGAGRLYSSKPPLLATLIAGEYWLLHKITGQTLGDNPYALGRIMLITFNVLPLMFAFALVGRMCERLGTTDWGRICVMAAATLATFLGTFAMVLNNHITAAVSVAICTYSLLRIWFDGERGWLHFALAGFFAAFAAANELPALSYFGLVGLLLLWQAPRRTLLAFTPAAAVVVAAFFVTNYIAHDTWRPPYAHRSDTDPDDNWYQYEYQRGSRTIKSYWYNPSGIDQGEPSQATYALHVLVGHHGVFSLTPIWLISFVGLGIWLAAGDGKLRLLSAGILVLSLVCLAFYLMRPEIDRNYGGMTSCFRWMLWFAPLWLIAMLPAADRMSRSRAMRFVAGLLLALSVLHASYPTWNPWTHPSLARWMVWMGWIEF
jgi:hypothetical protein